MHLLIEEEAEAEEEEGKVARALARAQAEGLLPPQCQSLLKTPPGILGRSLHQAALGKARQAEAGELLQRESQAANMASYSDPLTTEERMVFCRQRTPISRRLRRSVRPRHSRGPTHRPRSHRGVETNLAKSRRRSLHLARATSLRLPQFHPEAS